MLTPDLRRSQAKSATAVYRVSERSADAMLKHPRATPRYQSVADD